MEYTSENCEKVAWEIVDAMELDDLRQMVFEDLYDLMNHNKECFDLNVESLEG
jgi:hypothetical protein